MTQPLSWTIHGNDRLSEVLERIDANLTRLGRKMDQVGNDATQMGRKMGGAENPTRRIGDAADHSSGRLDRLGDRMSSVASRVGQMAAALTAAAAVGIGALGAIAVKTASANEQAAISFELLLGSAERAQKFLAEVQKFAAATPFEMPQLRTAASRLLAVGVEANHIIPLLRALGDATSGMGTGAEGIERAITALSQMRMKTKVSAEEMLQLTEAGIPAWQALAAVLKTDVSTAMKMVERREVDAQKVFEAIEQRAGPAMQRLSGMMERQSTTLAGVWSTFKDNASQALATFAEPALPALKKLVEDAGAAVPRVLEKLRNIGKQVGDIFKGSDVPERLLNALRDMGSNVLPVLKGAWDRIVKTVADNREGLEKLGRFIADIAIPLMGQGLVNTILTVEITLEAIITVAARVVDAIKFMTQMFLSNMKLILDAAVLTYGWVPVLGDKLREAQAKFDEFANNVMNKLNALDGKTANVRVNFTASGTKWTPAGADIPFGGGFQERAAGGPVWPGQVYRWQEQGSEWLMLGGGSGRVMSNQDVRSAQSGAGGGDVLGVLIVRHVTPSGETMREELLQLKRQRGFGSLGLA